MPVIQNFIFKSEYKIGKVNQLFAKYKHFI